MYAAARHGHLRAQNTHLGIADTATEPIVSCTVICAQRMCLALGQRSVGGCRLALNCLVCVGRCPSSDQAGSDAEGEEAQPSAGTSDRRWGRRRCQPSCQRRRSHSRQQHPQQSQRPVVQRRGQREEMHPDAEADPYQPNHTNAKKPSTATVTPRSRPAGKKLATWSTTPSSHPSLPPACLGMQGSARAGQYIGQSLRKPRGDSVRHRPHRGRSLRKMSLQKRRNDSG